MENSVKGALASWKHKNKDKLRRHGKSPFCVIWSVRRQRNHVAFEKGELNIQQWKASFVATFWCWNRSR